MGRTCSSSSSPLNQALKGDVGSQGHPLRPSDSHTELTRVSIYLAGHSLTMSWKAFSMAPTTKLSWVTSFCEDQQD